jgi:ureidoglycolate hydrolase
LRTIRVTLEPMTPETFEPFGHLIDAPRSDAPDLQGDLTSGWGVPFEADGSVEVLALHTPYGGSRFTKLERHFHVTQAFVAVGGSVSGVAVAPGARDGPDLERIRAFFIEPPQGYVLGRGVWHSLDRFPLYGPGSTFVMVTERETTRELREPRDTWVRTEQVDYSAAGLEFLLALPETSART